MNGRPLEVDGKYAAFGRLPSAKDVRSNMSAGGKAAKAKVTDDMLHMVDVVRPKLVADGMFLVGLDIVGDKLMEINVFSPGGLGSAQSLVEVDFAPIIIEELERKVRIRKHNPGLDNRSLATS
jgi:glutathione synthase